MTEKTSELVNLRLEGKSLDALQVIQNETGGSKASAVRQALVLYSRALLSEKNGSPVKLGEQEVILL